MCTIHSGSRSSPSRVRHEANPCDLSLYRKASSNHKPPLALCHTYIYIRTPPAQVQPAVLSRWYQCPIVKTTQCTTTLTRTPRHLCLWVSIPMLPTRRGRLTTATILPRWLTTRTEPCTPPSQRRPTSTTTLAGRARAPFQRTATSQEDPPTCPACRHRPRRWARRSPTPVSSLRCRSGRPTDWA